MLVEHNKADSIPKTLTPFVSPSYCRTLLYGVKPFQREVLTELDKGSAHDLPEAFGALQEIKDKTHL